MRRQEMRWLGTARVSAVALMVLTLLLGRPSWAQGKGDVGLDLQPWSTRSLERRAGHENEVLHERRACFSLGTHIYDICYKAGLNAAIPDEAFPLEGYIGMPRPTSCNWYHSGFLQIRLNGEDVGRTRLNSMLVSERGSRGILDMVWHHRLGATRVRFAGLPGQDCLFCEVVVDPAVSGTQLRIEARCYPSFFTAHHKRQGARIIQTPVTLIQEGEKTALPGAENWWALYADGVFDVAKGEGHGPCAMLVLPEQAEEIAFAPGGYAVTTTILCPPGTRVVRMAFWDFKGQTNAVALAGMRANAERIRRELSEMDFTPAAVKNVDIGAIRAEIQRAVQSEAARAALGDRIAAVREWLALWAPAPGDREKGQAVDGVLAEEALLESIDKYRQFKWDIKLAELLAEL